MDQDFAEWIVRNLLPDEAIDDLQRFYDEAKESGLEIRPVLLPKPNTSNPITYEEALNLARELDRYGLTRLKKGA